MAEDFLAVYWMKGLSKRDRCSAFLYWAHLNEKTHLSAEVKKLKKNRGKYEANEYRARLCYYWRKLDHSNEQIDNLREELKRIWVRETNRRVGAGW